MVYLHKKHHLSGALARPLFYLMNRIDKGFPFRRSFQSMKRSVWFLVIAAIAPSLFLISSCAGPEVRAERWEERADRRDTRLEDRSDRRQQRADQRR